MPSISDAFKNQIGIDSVEDIPIQYREEVLERVKNIDSYDYTGNIIPGEVTGVISNYENISREFSDRDLIYFGHGTTVDIDTLASILREGLFVKNPSAYRGYDSKLRGLESTSLVFSEGSDNLFENNYDLLNNWPHKKADKVIIIVLPKEYLFGRGELTSQLSDPFEQFYVGNEEDGYHLRPEFIKGIYDADSHSFIPNKNFYKNLSGVELESFFSELDDSYIKSYAKNVRVSPKDINRELPIDKSKMDTLNIMWYTEQLDKLIKYEESNKRVIDYDDEEDEEVDLDEWEKELAEWEAEWDEILEEKEDNLSR